MTAPSGPGALGGPPGPPAREPCGPAAAWLLRQEGQPLTTDPLRSAATGHLGHRPRLPHLPLPPGEGAGTGPAVAADLWGTSPSFGKDKGGPSGNGGAGGEGALAWARHPSVRAPPHCAGPAFLREPRSRPSLPHPAHGLDQEANDQGAASVGSVVSPLSPPRIHCSSCFYPATEFFKAASGPRAWDQV